MDSLFSVVRTEKKYSISEVQKNILKQRLSKVLKTDQNSTQDGYIVRSLYFDSIYDDDYFDKIEGLELRKKIRLRIYTPHQQKVKLELKQKQGAAQKKHSLWIERQTAEEMICGNYSGLLKANSVFAQQIYQTMQVGLYRPKCIVEYKRNAFTESSNDIRITLDSEIMAGNLFERFFSENPFLTLARKEPVLEVKYNGFLLSNVKQIVDFADAPELAISKYTLCRQILGAG